VRWLDACCGEGRALREASQLWTSMPWSRHLEIVGLDLWDDLPPSQASADGPALRFVGADIADWTPPDVPLDLITCVHGLHYLPNKLGFLERAYSWLAPDGGLLLAHLDTANVRQEGSETTDLWATLARRARKQGVTLRLSNHLLRLQRTPDSPNTLTFDCSFVGRTVSPKPNFSGMTVIDSWYRQRESA
jgi:SAM-dependent methyltransferase